MKTKIWLALSTLILTSLMAPPTMGMGPEKEKGDQVTGSEARMEHRKEITAFRMSQREEYQKLISLRQEHRKEITAFRMSQREEYQKLISLRQEERKEHRKEITAFRISRRAAG